MKIREERNRVARRGNDDGPRAFYESAFPSGAPGVIEINRRSVSLGMGLRWDRSRGSRRSVTRRRKPVEKKKEIGKRRKLFEDICDCRLRKRYTVYIAINWRLRIIDLELTCLFSSKRIFFACEDSMSSNNIRALLLLLYY